MIKWERERKNDKRKRGKINRMLKRESLIANIKNREIMRKQRRENRKKN